MAVLALVRSVAAVVVVVAHPTTVDAPPVAARELVSAAVCHRRAVEQRGVLVRPVHAVRIAVTQPLFRYALCPVPRLVRLTRELGRLVAFTVVCGETKQKKFMTRGDLISSLSLFLSPKRNKYAFLKPGLFSTI